MNVTSKTESADLSASRPHDLDSIVSYTSSLGGHAPGICPLGCLLTLSPDSAPVSCLSVHPFTSSERGRRVLPQWPVSAEQGTWQRCALQMWASMASPLGMKCKSVFQIPVLRPKPPPQVMGGGGGGLWAWLGREGEALMSESKCPVKGAGERHPTLFPPCGATAGRALMPKMPSQN